MARTRDRGDPPGRGTLTRTDEALTAVFREEAARLTASLVRVLGDFGAAEEVVADALLIAWERWPADGIPGNPGAWLWRVARHRAIDRLRRDARYAEKLAELTAIAAAPAGQDEDDRLRLIFTCCHPALSPEAQVALTLRTVCGLSTAEIASAFLVSQAAIVQRLTRARRKIAQARIPYRVPADEELAGRLGQVCSVIYLTFNEGIRLRS
jgi:RNA polymerase sigma factor (sigma-70 family)